MRTYKPLLGWLAFTVFLHLLSVSLGLVPGWFAMATGTAFVCGGAVALLLAPNVTIWDRQQKVMYMSSQQCPTNPTLTHASLLYYALQMEELAETGQTLSAILARSANHAVWSGSGAALATINMNLEKSRKAMALAALAVRSNLLDVPKHLSIPLTKSQAHALLDDNVDVLVTVAGFGLASGLPTPDGYEAVQDSNESKANPATGMIDKTLDGKWIKGANYVKPDLDAVLSANWREPMDSPI